MIEKIYPWENNFVRVEHPTRIGARDCVVKNLELEETIDFLNKYHFQKSCDGQIVRLGLLFNGILIGVMTFGRARFTRKVQWELLRLCYHPSYLVIGGSERLFTQFVKEYGPNSIISYCDKSKFSGNVYLRLGMKKIQVGRPRKYFWRDFDKRHIDSKLLSMFGADKLLGTKYGKGSNNEEVLLKEGFEIIKDEGQDAYLYLDNSATSCSIGNIKLDSVSCFKTDERKEKQKERIERYKEFCRTDSGKEMCQKRNEKIKQFNLTDEGKNKKEERIQALKDFYSTEDGKKAKALQVMKFKENLKRKDYQERRKIGDKKRSEWAKTEDGKRKIKIATKQRVDNMIANYTLKVNAMSEEEWNDFLKKHPRTTLKKYRK